MGENSNLDKLRIEAIFQRDDGTLNMLRNRYVNKIFKCWEYKNGTTSLEYIDYKTLKCTFNIIKFGDMIYFFKDGTSDNIFFRPENCPYWFMCMIDQNKKYTIGSMDKNFDFERFVKSKEGGKILNQFVFELTMLYLLILYMNEKPDYFQVDDTPSWEIKKSENRKNKNANYKYTKIVKNYVVSKEKISKSHIEINCPCWSVRGHYRHYKSGKVIFVESYKKGKERKEKEPKIKMYKLEKIKESEENHG